jgi:hypothetical protein
LPNIHRAKSLIVGQNNYILNIQPPIKFHNYLINQNTTSLA